MVRYLANSPNCCSGQFNTPATCPSSGTCIIVNKRYRVCLMSFTTGVEFYSYFHSNCPNAYAYAFDDAAGLKTCDSGLNADYTLTFCPPPAWLNPWSGSKVLSRTVTDGMTMFWEWILWFGHVMVSEKVPEVKFRLNDHDGAWDKQSQGW